MQRRYVLQMARRDHRRRRVADDRQQYLGQRAGVAARQVRDGQNRDAAEAQRESRHPAGAQPFRVAEEAGRGYADYRHARYQQAGRGAGEVAFGVRQGPPGDHDLYAREGQHGAPVGADRLGQAALAYREGEQ
ncbi:hypothetical protein OG975_14180 [Streptomyces sp. NBC_00203]